MHRFPSRSIITRFRIAASLLCLKCLLAPVSAGILIFSIFTDDRELTILAIILGFLTILIIFFQWLVSARTRCPLCLTPVLASKDCAKHRKASSFLGSHRLRVALGIIFKDSFVCPYCHEKSAMEVRTHDKHPKSRHY